MSQPLPTRPSRPTRPVRPPHPRELGATRFFARPLSFDLECPRCGRLYRIRTNAGSRLKARKLGHNHTWHPGTSTFRCGGRFGCSKHYRIGLLAWDPPRGKGAQATPDDHVPGPRELAQLRSEGDGWWLPKTLSGIGRMDMTNLAVTDERPDPEEED